MWELNIYLTKTTGGGAILDEWAKLNAGEDIQSFADFVKIYAFFRKAQASFGVRNTRYRSRQGKSLDQKGESGLRVRVWVKSESLGRGERVWFRVGAQSFLVEIFGVAGNVNKLSIETQMWEMTSSRRGFSGEREGVNLNIFSFCDVPMKKV